MKKSCILVLSSLILAASSLDLLGLSLNVPTIQSQHSLGGALSPGRGSTGPGRDMTTPSSVPTRRPNGKPTKKPKISCSNSLTTINGGKKVCANTLLFEDYFNAASLNLSNWVKEQYIPQEPDYEFVTYEKESKNCYINRGRLHFKPIIRDDPYIANLDLTKGCTRKLCSMNSVGTLIPPIVSAKIRSQFSFLYGKVEVKAQLPRGDWIYPQIYLEPKSNTYGEGYESGRIWLAYARGNDDLTASDTGEQIGNSILYNGPVVAASEPERHNFVTITSAEKGYRWGDSFHVFTLTWSPEGISVNVDGIDQGFINPPFSTVDVPYANLWTTNMAPFDQEFSITLGVGVGGHSDFPDASTSNEVKKPWKKTNSKATTLFLNAEEDWYSTWAGENIALKIDYVKVWSL